MNIKSLATKTECLGLKSSLDLGSSLLLMSNLGAEVMAQLSGLLPLMWRTWIEFPASKCTCCRYSESVDRNTLCLSLSLASQTNKQTNLEDNWKIYTGQCFPIQLLKWWKRHLLDLQYKRLLSTSNASCELAKLSFQFYLTYLNNNIYSVYTVNAHLGHKAIIDKVQILRFKKIIFFAKCHTSLILNGFERYFLSNGKV